MKNGKKPRFIDACKNTCKNDINCKDYFLQRLNYYYNNKFYKRTYCSLCEKNKEKKKELKKPLTNFKVFHNNKCVCKNTEYKDKNGMCKICPKNAICDGSENFTCPIDMFKNNINNTCDICPDNAYCDGSTNVICNDSGYIYSVTDNKCINDNTYVDDSIVNIDDDSANSDYICPSNARCDESGDFTCNKHFTKKDNICERTSCPENELFYYSECLPCPENVICNGTESFKCIKNSYRKNDGTCQSCPENATCDGTVSFLCNKGYKQDGNRCEKFGCFENELLDNNSNTCLKCPNYAVCDGSTNFTCKSGYVLKSNKCYINKLINSIHTYTADVNKSIKFFYIDGTHDRYGINNVRNKYPIKWETERLVGVLSCYKHFWGRWKDYNAESVGVAFLIMDNNKNLRVIDNKGGRQTWGGNGRGVIFHHTTYDDPIYKITRYGRNHKNINSAITISNKKAKINKSNSFLQRIKKNGTHDIFNKSYIINFYKKIYKL